MCRGISEWRQTAFSVYVEHHNNRERRLKPFALRRNPLPRIITLQRVHIVEGLRIESTKSFTLFIALLFMLEYNTLRVLAVTMCMTTLFQLGLISMKMVNVIFRWNGKRFLKPKVHRLFFSLLLVSFAFVIFNLTHTHPPSQPQTQNNTKL